jgi:hypothetical protein
MAEMAHDGLDQQLTCDSWVIASPVAGGAGTVTLVHVSGVVGPVIAPDKMMGALVVVRPIRTQVVDDGQAICAKDPTPVGRGSAAKVTLVLAVVAP